MVLSELKLKQGVNLVLSDTSGNDAKLPVQETDGAVVFVLVVTCDLTIKKKTIPAITNKNRLIHNIELHLSILLFKMSKFGQKNPPREDKSDFRIYHSDYPENVYPPIFGNIPEEGCQVISIDPAIKHFAIRIEIWFKNKITPVYFNKLDFSIIKGHENEKGECVVSPIVLSQISDLLDALAPYTQNTKLIGIERQMPVNTRATRIYQHVLTYFLSFARVGFFNYPIMILDINAHLKTRILGYCDKNINVKVWGIGVALELLQLRDDYESIKIINYHKGKAKTKGDDLADTVIQIEALVKLWKKMFYERTIIPTQDPNKLTAFLAGDATKIVNLN